MSVEEFKFDGWKAVPSRNLLVRLSDGEEFHLEPKNMDVLAELARHSGEVLSRQHFQDSVWGGRLIVDEGLTRCISELRRLLGDDPRQPVFIETLSKRGYRFLLAVSYLTPAAGETISSVSDVQHKQATASKGLRVSITLGIALLLGVIYLLVSDNPPSEDALQVEISSPDELFEVFDNRPINQFKAIWTPKQGAGQVVTVLGKQFDSGAEATLNLSIFTADVRLLNTVLPFATEKDRYQAVSNLVSTLELLTVRNVDPGIVKLPQHLRLTYQQATHLTMEADEQGLREALQKFDSILNERPDFIEAMVGKSSVLRGLAVFAKLEDRTKYVNLDALLMQHLALKSPQHPYLIAKTFKQIPGREDWASYEQVLLDVVAAAPSCFECVRSLANFYLMVGWRDKAIALHEKHLAFYPLSSMAHSELAMAYSRAGDAEAVKKHVDVVRLMGKERWVLPAEANYYLMTGNVEAWVFSWERFFDRQGLTGPMRDHAAVVATGDTAKLKAHFDKLDRLDFNLAINVKEFELLFARMEKNIAQGEYRDFSLIHGWRYSRNKITATYMDGLKDLQNHPRVAEFFKSVGLTAFWNQRQEWPDECVLDEPPLYCEKPASGNRLET